MSRRATFRQDDVTRALKGAEAAGVKVAVLQIRPDGTMMIVPASDQPLPDAGNDLDDRLDAFGAM